VLALLMSYVKIANSSISKNDISQKSKLFEPVIRVLLSKGVDSAFIFKIIGDKNTIFHEKYLRINVLNFNSKPDYSAHYNRESTRESAKYLRKYYDIFQKTEDKYLVPKETIASILWVETRFGQNTGNHSVLSVFLSTALSNQAQYLKMNRDNLISEFDGTEQELAALDQKLIQRSNKKTNWAIDELIALYQINKKNPNWIFDLKGSWAGAFGYSQFLPSSYLKWAVDGNNDGKIDLYNIEDAIFSVANYLKTNGWSPLYENQKAAVFHYNNSNDYVKAIFRLSNKLKPKEEIDSLQIEAEAE
jgi:membrane-bound lytic murein transglycosylase B